MRLSIVDQSPVPAGATPADALDNTIDLARAADRLGYRAVPGSPKASPPYPMFASPAPGDHDRPGRVGDIRDPVSARAPGAAAPLRSAQVARAFRVLHTLYPDRIDLGIGRASGSGALEAYALLRDRQRQMPDDFPDQLAELLAFLRGTFPADHPFRQILVTPQMPGAPPVWLLGSSAWSAHAGRAGHPYAFAHFIGSDATRSSLDYYRTHVAADAEVAGRAGRSWRSALSAPTPTRRPSGCTRASAC